MIGRRLNSNSIGSASPLADLGLVKAEKTCFRLAQSIGRLVKPQRLKGTLVRLIFQPLLVFY